MTTTCSKDYVLTVNPGNVDAYWTMDEASGNRIDSVRGLVMVASAVGSGTVGLADGPGLIGNCCSLVPGSNLSVGIRTGDLAALSLGGNGFSTFGWFRTVGGSPPVVLPLLGVLWNDIPADLSLQLGSGYVPGNGIWGGTDANGHSNSASFSYSQGVWNFFHLFYDPVLKKLGFAMNGGANTYIGTNVSYPASTIGGVGWACASVTPSSWTAQLDEYGMNLHRMLTPSQIAFLYNSGAGRTWPLTGFP